MQTKPVGGDFVVMVKDPIYTVPDHQFKHDDIFNQVAIHSEPNLMHNYLQIVKGADPDKWHHPIWIAHAKVHMNPNTFQYAVQCLAVAEHRRYAHFEAQFGGRFLPFRFAAGIAEGLWTAEAAAAVQKKGRPGVEWLEKDFGVPTLTKELMK